MQAEGTYSFKKKKKKATTVILEDVLYENQQKSSIYMYEVSMIYTNYTVTYSTNIYWAHSMSQELG